MTQMHLVPEKLDDVQADMTEAEAGESGCIVIANKPALLQDGCSRHRDGFRDRRADHRKTPKPHLGAG